MESDQGESAARYVVRPALAVLSLAAGIVALLFLFWWAAHVFLLAFAGIIFGIFLESCSRALTRWTRLPYSASLATVTILLLVVPSATAGLVGVLLSEQIGQFTQGLSDSISHLRHQAERMPLTRSLLDGLSEPSGLLGEGGLLAQLGGMTTGAVNAAADVLVVFFVGLFGAAQPERHLRGFLCLIPPAKRARAEEVITRVVQMLRRWIVGQVISMVAVGVLAALGLWLLGAPAPLTLGLIASGMQIVPYLGPFVSAIPAILLAWAQSPMLAFYVALLYLGVHGVESYVLMPIVQSRAIELPPAVLILAAVLLFSLAGILGVLLAAPLILSVIILVRMLYVDDVLGDRSSC